MLRIYRSLMGLYPAPYRHQFSDVMITVFQEVQAGGAEESRSARGAFYIREIVGLLVGALREHLRALGGAHVWLPFPTRRFTMHTEFRFPKSTAVLMTVILAGIVLAIEKGKAIQSSLPNLNPHIGPIQPSHLTFLPTVALIFMFFCAAGVAGWAILLALRRSGVHRLAGMSAERK